MDQHITGRWFLLTSVHRSWASWTSRDVAIEPHLAVDGRQLNWVPAFLVKWRPKAPWEASTDRSGSSLVRVVWVGRRNIRKSRLFSSPPPQSSPFFPYFLFLCLLRRRCSGTPARQTRNKGRTNFEASELQAALGSTDEAGQVKAVSSQHGVSQPRPEVNGQVRWTTFTKRAVVLGHGAAGLGAGRGLHEVDFEVRHPRQPPEGGAGCAGCDHQKERWEKDLPKWAR